MFSLYNLLVLEIILFDVIHNFSLNTNIVFTDFNTKTIDFAIKNL